MTDSPDDFIAQNRKPWKAYVVSEDNPISAELDPQFQGESDWLNKMVVGGDVIEDAIAGAFIDFFCDQIRYDHDAGKWYYVERGIWRRNETRLVFEYVRRAVRKVALARKTKRERKSAGRYAFAGGVEKFCQSDDRVACTSELWDRDPWLLGTPNGVIDLKTGERRIASRRDYISCTTAVAPADTADCPHWLAFLAEATSGDAELQLFLQCWVGYCLTGLTLEQSLVFIYGDGGTGKSTLINTLMRIWGDYGHVAQMQTFTASRYDRHDEELASLRGRRLVIASETEEGRRWKEVLVKQLTGGDPIRAKFMARNSFQFEPQFKLMFVGNHTPHLVNLDEAVRRQFNIVPFEKKPAQPDKALEEKLRAEWPGILRWAIDGCLAWQQQGLGRPRAVINATETYFSDQDTFAEWLAEKCRVEVDNPHYSESSADLFASWSTYAKAAGEDPGSRKSFATRMNRKGLFSEQIRAHRGKGFRGVVLTVPKYDAGEK